jgi:rRNA maturation endonuclease Nob1
MNNVQKVKDAYENGQCPDCQEDIPLSTVEGDECENCGHIFWLERENDND